jgi:hypothetical protein
LQRLADAREDRSPQRKENFERAMNELLPVLNAADPRIKVVTRIDSVVDTWRRICSSGPAKLPVPKLHAQFEHTYLARGGETITEISRKYGFSDTGPLCHPAYGYSPNMRLKAGDKIYVPYHPKALKQMIDSSLTMMNRAKEFLQEFKEKQHAETEKLENYLLLLDGIAILCSFGAGLAVGAGKVGAVMAPKGLAAVMPSVAKEATKEGTKEMLKLIEVEMGKTMAEVVGMAADASKKPKQGLFLVIRHSLGIFSPGYWTSLVAALWQKEPDAFLYGPEGVEHKRFHELASRTEHYCYLLKIKVDSMINQLASRIYSYKC